MSAVSFSYSVSSQSGGDKYTIIVGSTTVANGISGTSSSSWSGSLAKDATITFKYVKNANTYAGSDHATFSNLKVTLTNSTNVARPVQKIYVGGSDGKAKLVKKVYIGDSSNKARLAYPDPCDMCQTACQLSC